MPPWFAIGGAAALLWIAHQLGGPTRHGAGDEGGAGGAAAAEDSGSGSSEGEYVIPGETIGGRRVPGYEQFYGDEGGGDNGGFGEAYTDAGVSAYTSGPLYQPPTAEQLATAASYGWNVQQIPNYSADVAGGAATVPYVTDVGGQGAYVTPQGSVFEGALPTYSPSPAPLPYNAAVPTAQLPAQKLRQLQ